MIVTTWIVKSKTFNQDKDRKSTVLASFVYLLYINTVSWQSRSGVKWMYLQVSLTEFCKRKVVTWYQLLLGRDWIVFFRNRLFDRYLPFCCLSVSTLFFLFLMKRNMINHTLKFNIFYLFNRVWHTAQQTESQKNCIPRGLSHTIPWLSKKLSRP